MQKSFVHNLNQIIGSNFADKKYIVAVSGGADSMVLAHLCKQVALNITIAHCNFKLRGNESDEDAAFVANTAATLGMAFEVETFDTSGYAAKHNVGTQVAARELRYAWFEALRVKHNADYILVAHHKNDNVETFFINLLRGTGLKGLTGIKAMNKYVVRPLLTESKEQILRYAQLNKIDFREDSSNASDKYLRNEIRHDLLPLLNSIRQGSVEKIDEEIVFFRQAQEELTYWSEVLKQSCWKEEKQRVLIAIDELNKVNNPVYYLLDWLASFGFNATQLTDVWHAKQVGASVYSNTHQLIIDRNYLILVALDESARQVNQVVQSISDASDFITLREIDSSEVNFDVANKKAFLALEKVCFPLTIRTWKQGDLVKPFGMKGRKKLVSDILIDAKVDEISKKHTFLVEDAQQEIIWLPNHCVSESVKINNSTKKVLLMEIV